MARFSFEESDNYGVGNNNYFNLKDDKDTAIIRFLYNDLNDVRGVSVHEIQVGDKRMDVECLRAYNEPTHKCPLCAAGHKISAKLYVPVYDVDAKQSKIWTRGKTFFQKLSSLCSRYNPLVSMPFEIERNGRKGDTNTSYETYPTTQDNLRIEDFPEINPEGIAFQVKTYDELVEFLDTGVFKDDNGDVPTNMPTTNTHQHTAYIPNNQRTERQMPVRRRPSYNNEENF